MHTAFSSRLLPLPRRWCRSLTPFRSALFACPKWCICAGCPAPRFTTSSAGRLSWNKSPSAGKTWRGRSRKSPGGWPTVSPNATGATTHDDARSAKALFLACFLRRFRYSFAAVAKSTAGIGVPNNFMATRHAPCVFYVVAQAHPFSGLWCLFVHRGSFSDNGSPAGQPSGWLVFEGRLRQPCLGLPPVKLAFPVVVFQTTSRRLPSWLLPHPRHTCSLSLYLPPFVAQTVSPYLYAPRRRRRWTRRTPFPRPRLRPLVCRASAGGGGARMNSPPSPSKTSECLEHLRNVGQFVGELMQVRDCTSCVVTRPSSYSSLRDLPHDRPARRRGRRCNHRWFTGRATYENAITARITCRPVYRRAVACASGWPCANASTAIPTSPSTRWKAPSPPSWRASTCASMARKRPSDCLCALLEDLMQAGPLKAAPSLSFLRARRDGWALRPPSWHRLYCTEGEKPWKWT